jgi:hypothetical protein
MDTISFECANCRKLLKVGADKAGLKAKCPHCNTPLQVPTLDAGSAPPSRPAAGSPPAKRPSTGDEVVQARWVPDKPPIRETPRRRSRDEDEDDEEDVRSRVRPGKRSSDRYDDEDEDDDRPRARKRSRDDEEDDRPRKRARARDEDEDDEDDRPRRRGRARAEEDDEDDRPRRRRGRDDEDEDDYDDRKSRKRRGKKRARGLGMMRVAALVGFIAGCIIAGSCVPQAVVYLMTTIAMASGSGGSAVFVFLKIEKILVLVFGVAALVGYSFNLAVPNRKGSLGFAIAALAVAVAWVVMFFIFDFLPVFGAAGQVAGLFGLSGGGHGGSLFGGWILMVLVEMLYCAQFILAIFFIRSIALSVKDRGLAGQGLTTVFLAAGYAGLRLITLIIIYIAVASVKSESGARTMLWIIMILNWIGLFAFVLMIVNYIRLFFSAQALEED